MLFQNNLKNPVYVLVYLQFLILIIFYFCTEHRDIKQIIFSTENKYKLNIRPHNDTEF